MPKRVLPDALGPFGYFGRVVGEQYGLCTCCGVRGGDPRDPATAHAYDTRLKGSAGNYIWGVGVPHKMQNFKVSEKFDHFIIKDKDGDFDFCLAYVDEDTCERVFGDITEHLIKKQEIEVKKAETRYMNQKAKLEELISAKVGNVE